MSTSDRRTFFKVAGAGAVAAGAAAVIPAAAGVEAGVATAAPSTARPAGASGAIAAYVPDLTRGELVVMVEGREVTVTDHRLVAGLAQAVHGAQSV